VNENDPLAGRPLVIAANRLPVMWVDGAWATSPGGLVRALLPLVRESRGKWVGWTGVATEQVAEPVAPIELEGIEMHPVPINKQELEMYYEGFANDTLWPLYHDALRDSGFHFEDWEAYRTVNERFAATLAAIAPPDAMVWVHDYHLQLVPQMLRAARSDVLIGFFNHIPFPPAELFARLPWRNEILEGLLGADLIGFQRARGAENFAMLAKQLLNAKAVFDDAPAKATPAEIRADDFSTATSLPIAPGWVEVNHHRSRIGAFPISIDTAEFDELATGRATRQQTSSLRTRLGEPEVIMLGVDRLDYTKGIGSRLQAVGSLFDEGRLDPERHVMVQIATPTREGVDHYREERADIERLVGEINGRHARLGYPVIHYLYRTLTLEELIPLYRVGDVMLVTPFRDGMNLVAKEYVATRIDNDGVLVLSEFTGAADELTDAVLVNPHDDEALKDAIEQAVEMHRHERRDRMQRMRSRVLSNDVVHWAEGFLRTLAMTATESTS
jgi:trehalose 6-phosphate synthase